MPVCAAKDTMIDPAALGKTMLHVYPDASELARVYRSDLGIAAAAGEIVAALADPDFTGFDRGETPLLQTGASNIRCRSAVPGASEFSRIASTASQQPVLLQPLDDLCGVDIVETGMPFLRGTAR